MLDSCDYIVYIKYDTTVVKSTSVQYSYVTAMQFCIDVIHKRYSIIYQ